MPFKSILCSNPNWILSILALFTCLSGLCCASDQLGTGDSFTVSSFSYPETTLRPFDLRYIRVDLPTWFSAVFIALNSDVDLDVTKVEKVPKSMLPIACFRDGSPPLPDASNISLKESAISGMNNLYVEQCFPMQKNITLRLTNEQISPGVWYIGLFNGIGAARTQSKMIIRGPTYSFSANVSVEACTNVMMMGEFCNSTVYPLSCTGPDVFDTSDGVALKPMVKSVMTCRNNFETLCVQEGGAKVYSLDIMNMVEEFSITATNVSFNSNASTNDANDVNLMCLVRHGAMPSATLHDYSSNLYKAPLTIQSPLIGRWYIVILPLNLARKIGDSADSDVRICYSMETRLSECPFGKAGPNCTMASYKLQTVLSRSISPFESYYLPIGGEVSSDSAKFPLEPLLSGSPNGGEADGIWTYFTMDIPRGAAGGNIHVHLSSNAKIGYEVYARFGGLPSIDSWDYYYANKSRRSDPSMFFMLYDSREDKVDFYIIYAREGTWGIGLRHLNINSDSSKGQTSMSLSLERCPNQCSSHGSCKFSFDATGLSSYSFCSCDRDHGGFDCGIELVSHKGHIRQSIFLIASNAAAILPAFWALRRKAWAEWIIYTASGISSGLYHACDVGTWCALNYNALQFMDFWLSFMAVVSTFVYLATISEAFKRAIHTGVAILTALMAVTKATRSSNIILVIVIGTLGLLIGWLIELSAKYRSLSFSFGVPSNFRQSLQAIKQWLYNLVKTLLRRFRWGFVLAGFAALAMAATSWTLETSETYWFWHSWWHITIYTSSFFFLCSKVNVVDSDENQLPPSSGNYALTRQDSFSRGV
ncbi:uncharacterized protein LOC114727797 isoform X2 [Neltuma alba]|uniref:uncharacterized protein LOC114727797 isoform X2 n=1 Tax=Neltuma alba TaxID=207710 RepID=UPI0010A3239D|nr:uncharacterized protein LOC114727797 isoform X2 [Prosopis alba]